MLRAIPLLLALAACSAAEPPLLIEESQENAPATLVGRAPQRPVEEVRATIRAEVQRLYGEDCDRVTVPDRAIVPVEFTGGGDPEYAVLLGRATCERLGSPNMWKGSGGDVVQFWLASGRPPHMIVEQQMSGFTPTGDGLTTLQHGSFCPDGAGPLACLVEYRWNGNDQDLEVVRRTLYGQKAANQPPRMQWDYEAITH